MKKIKLLLISILLISQCLSTYSMDLEQKQNQPKRRTKRRQRKNTPALRKKKKFLDNMKKLLIKELETKISNEKLETICKKTFRIINRKKEFNLLASIAGTKVEYLRYDYIERALTHASKASEELYDRSLSEWMCLDNSESEEDSQL